MADNYLERQRELYEMRKAEWLKKKNRRAIKPKQHTPPEKEKALQ